MVPIVAKKIHELTTNEYRQCWGLNLGKQFDMQWELVYERNLPESEAVAVMLKDDERILAWALMQPPGPHGNNWAAAFFVRPSERRKGYGSRLMRYAQYHFAPVQCWAHGSESGGFFRNFEDQIVCDKNTRTWIEGVHNYEAE